MKAGLYEIVCKKNSKRYIGASNSVNRRLNEHKTSLRRGLHSNRNLQKDFDFYKEQNFLFQKISLELDCEKKELFIKEKNLIAKYSVECLYNINKKPFAGQNHSDSVKKSISIENIGKSNKERKKPLFLNAIFYESITEAYEKTGIHRRLIRERCNSQEPKWVSYQWVSFGKKKL